MNDKIISIIHGLDDRAVRFHGLISAKAVRVREHRLCIDCKTCIPAGTLAITSSIKLKNSQKRRVYRHVDCAKRTVSAALSMEEELIDMDALTYAFADYS